MGDGTSHTHIVKRRLIGAHVDHAWHIGQVILVHQVRLALLERLQVLLTHTPPVPRPAVNLPGTVHGLAGRLILKDQPLYPVNIRLLLTEVGWVALEDRLHIRFVALEEEGSSANSALRLFQITELLYHFWGDEPHAPRVCQGTDQPDIGFFEEE